MAPKFDPKEKQISVAFVCLGNICRSPMAEAIFKHEVESQGYSKFFKRIDSFGTSGWHIGETPDSRSVKTCRKHNVPVDHYAQQITSADFDDFDYVIGMDEANISNLRHIKPRDSTAVVELFGHWKAKDSEFKTIVDDPYYGGIDGFEYNYKQICHFADQFLIQEIGTLD
ncbi:Low molecular weight phosphotyrosine protein phosphatase [Candida viswanathii]|uniref:Low molecular weight phosphotyrosine protein phosphatase n=1 Tax=Candida viswanathii TaxID=5486 RepID=A0A367YBG9_9ASCO|nr:Low molecular weight phosphotyrosine protein phosphatase [Candida viswanathii]